MDSATGFNPIGTLGAFQIGVLVSCVLFGVLTTQTYIYYSRFPDDSPKLKALVAFVWVCDLTDVLCVGNTLYIYTISNYAHPERIGRAIPKSLDAAIPPSGIIVLCGTSTVLAHPIQYKGSSPIEYMRSPRKYASLPSSVPCRCYKAQWEWLYTAGWGISAANDLAITAMLVVVLYRKRTHAFKKRNWDVVKFLTVKGIYIWFALWAINTRGNSEPHNNGSVKADSSLYVQSKFEGDASRNGRCFPAVVDTIGRFCISGFEHLLMRAFDRLCK
ncbi:hypothetical protein B0H19DRAFT_1064682 [Mycena capillaripes]|nr:hypothetical protein B0H19DRAFT_1064682 [Mycena capillaripes]